MSHHHHSFVRSSFFVLFSSFFAPSPSFLIDGVSAADQRLRGRRLRKELSARILEDTFSVAKVSKQHLKLRLEPLTAAKIVHYHLHFIPQPKANRGKSASASSSDDMVREELFAALLAHLVLDHFGDLLLVDDDDDDDDDDEDDNADKKQAATARREALLADAREVGLVDELDEFMEQTRKRNIYLLQLSPALRFRLDALQHFCGRLKSHLGTTP
jgi:hypothetical protein